MVTQMYFSRTVFGALELKRVYQRNMIIALIVGVSIHLGALAGYAILTGTGAEEIAAAAIKRKVVVDVYKIPPPRILDEPREKSPAVDLQKSTSFSPSIQPEPVPDKDISESPVMKTRAQVAIPDTLVSIGGNGSGDGNLQINYVPPVEKPVPSSSAFVSVDEMPVKINLPEPVYPEMARKAGIEGWSG